MQVGDILRKKTPRVATVRMNETVAIARATDARQQYQRARGQGCRSHRG
ncbi:hypothetical protein ACVI1L_005754 [Bradyrhizobium sp. USDA 4516]